MHIFKSRKICRVELCIDLFYAIIPTLFPCFLLICYQYILLHYSTLVLRIILSNVNYTTCAWTLSDPPPPPLSPKVMMTFVALGYKLNIVLNFLHHTYSSRCMQIKKFGEACGNLNPPINSQN